VVHDLIRLGIAKLQQAIAPKSQQGLDFLLSYLAPNGGGTAKITELLNAARTYPEPITKNAAWWEELFNAFGPVPQQVRAEVIRLAEVEVQQSAKMYHGLAGRQPPRQEQQPSADAAKLQAYLRAKAEREGAAGKLAGLKDEYAKMIGGHDPQIKVEAFDDVRHAIANPGQFRHSLQTRAHGLDNHRIASAAVRLLSKRMSEFFHAKLKEYDMTPEQLQELFDMAAKQKAAGQPLHPNLAAKIKTAIDFFNKTS